MNKEIYFDEEMRKGLMKGIKKATDAAASTLGPAGRTVIIEKNNGKFEITKDGITVLKAINLEDAIENIGANIIINASNESNNVVGDGSTTAAVLASGIIEEGLKSVSNGVNPIKLKRGIDYAVKDIVEQIKRDAVEIETKEQIAQVATISANNNKELGNLIADAIEKVGNDGSVTIADSKGTDTTIDYVEGMSFNNGYISPYFCVTENGVTEYENPYILITNKKLSSTDDLMGILEQSKREGKALLIIAPSVEGEVLTTLIVNNMRGVINVCAVKAPGFGDRQMDMLTDIAILTGTQVVNEETGFKLSETDVSELGTASSVKITKDDCTIVDGAGTKEAIESRIKTIKKDLEMATSDYDKEKIQDRLAKLTGGVAVIRVGAKTETEAKELRYKIEDSLNSTRASLEEGIIPGGGTELCQVKREILEIRKLDSEEQIGYDIVMKAITKPIKQIAENAGINGEVVANKVFTSEKGIGYDALNGTYVDMIKEGIIDPVKVTRVALENATSVASLVLTSGCTIVTIPNKDVNSSAIPMM